MAVLVTKGWTDPTPIGKAAKPRDSVVAMAQKYNIEYGKSHLYNLLDVCSEFPPSIRNLGLPFTVHSDVLRSIAWMKRNNVFDPRWNNGSSFEEVIEVRRAVLAKVLEARNTARAALKTFDRDDVWEVVCTELHDKLSDIEAIKAKSPKARKLAARKEKADKAKAAIEKTLGLLPLFTVDTKGENGAFLISAHNEAEAKSFAKKIPFEVITVRNFGISKMPVGVYVVTKFDTDSMAATAEPTT